MGEVSNKPRQDYNIGMGYGVLLGRDRLRFSAPTKVFGRVLTIRLAAAFF